MRAPSAAHRRLCARIRDGRARGRAQARSRSSFACGAIRTATSTKTGRTAARRCANATARARRRSAGTSATPSRARCATAAIWSAGAWRRASGKRCRCRSRCASCSPPTATRRWRARPPTSAPAPTPSWRRSRPTCSGCRSTTSASSSATRACRNRRSKADRGSRPRWRTASSTTAEAIRDELLRLAKQMPNSPLANAASDEVALADGKLVSKRDASRAVSIADAMRHGAVDRIEQEKTTNPAEDHTRAHNTHSAIFAEVKVDEQLGVDPRHPRRQRGRGRTHPEHQDRGQPDPGRRGLGHRHGAARGNADRSQVRPHHECQHRRVPCPGERRCARHQGDLRRRAGRQSIRSASRGVGEIGIVGVAAAIANAVYHATGSACATCRSRWISCTGREAGEGISGSVGSHIAVGQSVAAVRCQLAVARTAIMAAFVRSGRGVPLLVAIYLGLR